MKLKTLKDLEFLLSKIKPIRDFYDGEEDIILIKSDELKAEAVKWVKEDIREALKKCSEPYTLENIKWVICTDSNNIKTWMERFNLTEEDLI